MDYENLLALVEKVMRICTQTTAKSEALASLLIDKGYVTEEELRKKIEEEEKKTKKLAESLGSDTEQEN